MNRSKHRPNECELNNELSKERIENSSWVQCENPTCCKWRKLNRKQICSLDLVEPWFCFMNPEKRFSSCNDEQENYSEYEKSALKYQLKYIASDLNVGALVWTKLTGYERWPAIVLPDVNYENHHIWKDFDGEPLQYHVEYLGNRRSHGWIDTSNIELYRKVESKLNDLNNCTEKARSSHRRKGEKHKWQNVKKLRGKFKGCTVEEAINEANSLLDLLPHQRLSLCTTQQQQPAATPNNYSKDFIVPTSGSKKSKLTAGSSQLVYKAKQTEERIPEASIRSKNCQPTTSTLAKSKCSKQDKEVGRLCKNKRKPLSHDIFGSTPVGSRGRFLQSQDCLFDAVVPSTEDIHTVCSLSQFESLSGSRPRPQLLPKHGYAKLYEDHSLIKLNNPAHHVAITADEFLVLYSTRGNDSAASVLVEEDESCVLRQLTAVQHQLSSLASCLSDTWLL